MLVFMLFSLATMAVILALKLLPEHWVGASLWMVMMITTLLATWAIGRRADSQTQRRLVLGLTMILVGLALSGRRIISLFAQW
jgi:hypothetical protein